MKVENLKIKIISVLRWSERYTNTDMIYLIKNSFWLNANTFIVTILSFVLSIAFAKYLSKEVFGTYQFLISISTIIGALTLTGMNSAVTQAVARGYEGVLKKSVREQFRLSLIPLLAGIFVSLYYFLQNNIDISILILIVAIFLPLANALNTWTAFLSGKGEFGRYFKYSQIINFSYYGTMLAIVIVAPGSTALVAANFVVSLVSNLVVYFLVQKKYHPTEETDGSALNYGKKLSLSNILPLIATNIDNIMVFHLLGATDLAIYAFATNIPERFMGLLRPVATIAFPKLAQKDEKEVAKNIPQKTFKFFIISTITGIVYLILAPYIYHVFFQEYQNSILYSQIYVLSLVMSMAASIPITALFAMRSKNIFVFNILNPIFNSLIVVIGAYTFGIWGILFAKIISSTFSLFYSIFFVSKHT